jgi:hypothetical protein
MVAGLASRDIGIVIREVEGRFVAYRTDDNLGSVKRRFDGREISTNHVRLWRFVAHRIVNNGNVGFDGSDLNIT